ncbi:ABC transporter substrate-binding protein [Streptomyces sp. NPDC088354]|uniref:ABC transporter substrate-binding protein n=1 Tax=unclassified Streptomyces TaxID=2593676 RepID=UPI0029A6A293|nr:ABC transporter substrate-binding protein [Streptomyces sp. MI02-7b]MDX3076049.1 ABC transporter substrate-binding protein [Streptomyces sp. MI02-7b]
MSDWRSRTAVPLVSAAAGVALLVGCGVLPGGTGGSTGPIVVMTWAPQGTNATNMPGMPAMASTFAKYVNAKGGIGGRELKVVNCNEHNTSLGAQDCAQRAADEGAVAVVGSYSQYGAAFTSTLEAEGIPYIGGYGVTQDEFESPLSYPINGGLTTLMAGNGRQLAGKCDKVSLVRPDTAAGDLFARFLDTGLQDAGRTKATDLRAKEDSTDYNAIARQAVGENKAGECVSAALGDKTAGFFDAFRRTTTHDALTGKDEKPKALIASVLGSVQQSTLDSTGGASSPLEGAYVTGWYPPASDARWATMREAISKYAFGNNDIDPDDPGVQTTWIAYTAFAEVVDEIGRDAPITAATVKQAFDQAHGISTGGLTPPLGWREQDAASIIDQPRMVNGKVTYQKVVKGQLVAVSSGFVDMTKTLENAPRD